MNDACQVDFYVVLPEGQSAAQVACRLALKAWEQGHHVLVLAGDESEAQSLDSLMWEYPPGRFLPHSTNAPDTGTPVSIGTQGTALPAGRDVLINLSDQPVPETGGLRRLLEIVPHEEERRPASRRKYTVYRDRGLETTTHHLKQ
jgi:DNA polymerase-3 subunit chi